MFGWFGGLRIESAYGNIFLLKLTRAGYVSTAVLKFNFTRNPRAEGWSVVSLTYLGSTNKVGIIAF